MVQLELPNNPVPIPPGECIPGLEDWTCIWPLPEQPYYEWIIFEENIYYFCDPVVYPGAPAYFDVATYCIPEPATMGLLALGACVAVLRRRRK